MHSAEQRAEFQDSYKALKDLRNQHDAEMRLLISGEVTNTERLFELVSELNAALGRFVTAGAPFVGFKKLNT